MITTSIIKIKKKKYQRESESQCVILLSLSVCVRERDKGKNRGSFGNLIIGGGAGQPQTFVKVSQMFVYKYSLTDHFSRFFFFFVDKNMKVFKNRYVTKFEFFH